MTATDAHRVIDALRVAPKQDRSDERVKAIIEAARAHYAEVGRDEFTVGPVAEAVGCSTATVFRYFSKNQLLHLVEEQDDLARQTKIRDLLNQGRHARRLADKNSAFDDLLALVG